MDSQRIGIAAFKILSTGQFLSNLSRIFIVLRSNSNNYVLKKNIEKNIRF